MGTTNRAFQPKSYNATKNTPIEKYIYGTGGRGVGKHARAEQLKEILEYKPVLQPDEFYKDVLLDNIKNTIERVQKYTIPVGTTTNSTEGMAYTPSATSTSSDPLDHLKYWTSTTPSFSGTSSDTKRRDPLQQEDLQKTRRTIDWQTERMLNNYSDLMQMLGGILDAIQCRRIEAEELRISEPFLYRTLVNRCDEDMMFVVAIMSSFKIEQDPINSQGEKIRYQLRERGLI